MGEGKIKFVIAPDKYKGSLTGFEFCDAVEEGISKVYKKAEIHKMPLADGGDGTMEVVQHYLQGKKITLKVSDPIHRPILGTYIYSSKTRTAYIEMAEASGLRLLKDTEQDCMRSSTYGTGELIADALEQGASEIILGIGGSATNDGGIGMANALGYRFLDENDRELKSIGGNLTHIRKVDSSKVNSRLRETQIKVACDVINPFYGENGAARVYAPQKGASNAEVNILDEGLRSFAKIIQGQFDVELQEIQGAGAAGGMGGGAVAFLNARLTSGIDLIKELADFDNAIEGSNWIITGEGKLDEQTLSGKTINGVVISAVKKQIPVAALCGSVNISIEQQEAFGLVYVAAIIQNVSTLPEALEFSYSNLVRSSYNFARICAWYGKNRSRDQ